MVIITILIIMMMIVIMIVIIVIVIMNGGGCETLGGSLCASSPQVREPESHLHDRNVYTTTNKCS